MTIYQLSIYDGTKVDIIIKDYDLNTIYEWHVETLDEWQNVRSFIDETYEDVRIFSVDVMATGIRILVKVNL